MFEKLSPKSIKIIMVAQEEARSLLSSFVLPEHIFLALLKEEGSIAHKLLIEKGLKYDTVYQNIENNNPNNSKFLRLEMQFSPSTKHAVEIASDEAKRLNEDLVEPEHLLLGIVNIGESNITELIKDAGINLSRIRWHLLRLREQTEISEDEEKELIQLNISFTSDLTYKVENKEIQSVIEYSDYIEEIISSLNLYEKHYPIIIGKSGVGKRSLIIGLTQYLMEGKIYKELQNFRVLEFNFNSFIYEIDNLQEISKNFKKFTTELNNTKDVILVISDLTVLFKFKEYQSLYNMFMHFINTTDKNIIFVEDITDFDLYIKNNILNNFLIQVEIKEADIDKTLEVLEFKSKKMEKYYDISIDKDVINEIIKASKELNPNAYYPDIAVKLLDLLFSKKKFSKSISQSKIKEIEKNLRALRDKRDEYMNNNDYKKLEQLKIKAQIYEEEIKQLNVNISTNIKPLLTIRDVQLILDKKNLMEDI
ncbi:MAG: Clp protease N-terminal domain-containing protein [Candidatus Sericytochromatia bacterium]